MTVFNLYILYCPVAVKSKEGLLMIRSNVHEQEMTQAIFDSFKHKSLAV